MAGLDAIKHFDDGGSTGSPAMEDAVQGAAETYTAGANVKSTAKGAPFDYGKIALDPTQTRELLANMQDIIDQRTGGWHDFMSGLKDAAAWAVPGLKGQKALALQAREQEKRAEMNDVYNMRAQMASLQSAQTQAQQRKNWADKILGGGGAGGQGVVQGGGAQQGIYGGINIPPEIRMAISGSADPAAALEKYLTTAGTERTKAQFNPAWGALTDVIGKNGQIEKVPLWQAVDIAMNNPNNPTNRAVVQAASQVQGPAPSLPATAAGVNQYNVGNVRPAGATTGFQQPKSFDEGLQIMDQNLQAYGSKHGIDTLRGVISRWAPPSENDTETLIKTASQRLGISPDQKIDLSNPAQRQAIGTALMLQEKGPKQLFAAAPTGTMTDVGTGAGGPPRAMPGESVGSLQKRTELWQKGEEERLKGVGKQSEDTTKFLDSLHSAAEAASSKRPMLQHIGSHAANNPEDFNVSAQTSGRLGIMGGLVNYARDQGGETAAENREKALAPYFYSKEAIGRRTKTDMLSGQIAMGSSKELLGDSSVRLGAQIEKLFLDFKGLGTKGTAEMNVQGSKMYDIMLERKERQDAAARDYVAQHPAATPTEIRNSAAFRDVDNWASNQLKGVFGSKAEVSAQDMAREELRRRQEAKKANQ